MFLVDVLEAFVNDIVLCRKGDSIALNLAAAGVLMPLPAPATMLRGRARGPALAVDDAMTPLEAASLLRGEEVAVGRAESLALTTGARMPPSSPTSWCCDPGTFLLDTRALLAVVEGVVPLLRVVVDPGVPLAESRLIRAALALSGGRDRGVAVAGVIDTLGVIVEGRETANG